jgi:8-oxo-dGTP diphosphatase
MLERRSGDGFMRCSDGHVRWGIYGAAGALFIIDTPDGDREVMLQKRSAFAHEGGTWSCAGGASDLGETPYEAALREASEEIGTVPEDHELIGEYVFAPAADWNYTTVVVRVQQYFGASMNFETDAVAWVAVAEIDALSLHPGFAAAWPHLRTIIEAS